MFKKIKNILFILLAICLILIIGLLLYLHISNRNKIAILGYHSIMPHDMNTSGDNLIVDSEKFEKELKLLKKLGYKTMTLDEFYCWKNNECKKKKDLC